MLLGRARVLLAILTRLLGKPLKTMFLPGLRVIRTKPLLPRLPALDLPMLLGGLLGFYSGINCNSEPRLQGFRLKLF
jgi:hypothetical protein